MSSEYYSLEKAAEVLGLPPAEINRLREKSLLRAFRDGTSWKFRKVDVDNYLAETIKNRGKTDNTSAGESDFDLLSMDDDAEETPTLLADSASFDALMEDGLSMADEMIDAQPVASAGQDDDLSLDDDGLSLADDPAPVGRSNSKSDVDLALDDDDLVLDAAGSSPQLDLAGDSGISLLDVADDEVELQDADKGGSDVVLELADDDDILSLLDDDTPAEHTSTIAIPVEDDFQLTPDSGPMIADDSESASQVIALDEDNMFGAPVEGGAFGAESPFGVAPGMDTAGEAGAFAAATPFTSSAAPGEFVAATPAFAAPTVTEAAYSPMLVFFLVLVTALLAIPGIMMLDVIIHIWSWKEPYVVNSSIMDMICNMVGLK